ncbi:CoB--CoM heterodisulfide reductase iron-sulfur subunit B family protein [Telmatospirillum sp.]|uniref:CoB--CoM heterodisulfide reductase iron-sulfur subunit B family protein n=1 Tax=Telmatospirillum sp. TaxID=2079197 RepID=UPI002841D7E3|nr:CoB--CoM heterodisulfide reductase iron-sulfur subunit B family protein [Telmatospirillum sp.]MDR3440229.1 CoB--CoM heterodisulfide reductase iron-sulfur subunit B family protein [Telmatospirillum sp.]
MTRKFAFFPGCVLDSAAREARMATEAVAARLGIELVEIPGWSCCGASHVQDIDPNAALAANARNLALAEQLGLDVLTACSTCALMLRTARQELLNGRKNDINKVLAQAGLEYKGTAEVSHILWLLADTAAEWGPQVKNPLRKVRVASFYGCHTVRPPQVMTHESHLDPHSMETVITACGAEPVLIPDRLKCCGFHAVFPAEPTAHRLTASAADDAKKGGADCLLTPCPLCQLQLDMYQPDARKTEGKGGDTPVLHLTQLVGLALGIDREKLGLSRHIVSTESLLAKC